MWYYGVFMGNSVTSGCGKEICTYAKKRIDKFHQLLFVAFLMVCMLGGICIVQSSLRCSFITAILW